jgi:hypothetical protein
VYIFFFCITKEGPGNNKKKMSSGYSYVLITNGIGSDSDIPRLLDQLHIPKDNRNFTQLSLLDLIGQNQTYKDAVDKVITSAEPTLCRQHVYDYTSKVQCDGKNNASYEATEDSDGKEIPPDCLRRPVCLERAIENPDTSIEPYKGFYERMEKEFSNRRKDEVVQEQLRAQIDEAVQQRKNIVFEATEDADISNQLIKRVYNEADYRIFQVIEVQTVKQQLEENKTDAVIRLNKYLVNSGNPAPRMPHLDKSDIKRTKLSTVDYIFDSIDTIQPRAKVRLVVLTNTNQASSTPIYDSDEVQADKDVAKLDVVKAFSPNISKELKAQCDRLKKISAQLQILANEDSWTYLFKRYRDTIKFREFHELSRAIYSLNEQDDALLSSMFRGEKLLEKVTFNMVIGSAVEIFVFMSLLQHVFYYKTNTKERLMELFRNQEGHHQEAWPDTYRILLLIGMVFEEQSKTVVPLQLRTELEWFASLFIGVNKAINTLLNNDIKRLEESVKRSQPDADGIKEEIGANMIPGKIKYEVTVKQCKRSFFGIKKCHESQEYQEFDRFGELKLKEALQKEVFANFTAKHALTKDLLNWITQNGEDSAVLAHVMCTRGDEKVVKQFFAQLTQPKRTGMVEHFPPPGQKLKPVLFAPPLKTKAL